MNQLFPMRLVTLSVLSGLVLATAMVGYESMNANTTGSDLTIVQQNGNYNRSRNTSYRGSGRRQILVIKPAPDQWSTETII